MPKRTDIKKILIIGSGPIIIGQACEFDYSGSQAVKMLRADGYKIVLINSNPATIMTDPELADATYVEPLTVDFLERVIVKEKPDALLPTLGGQTALNLAVQASEKGILKKYGVEMIGAKLEAIHKAEDRKLFKEAMIECGIDLPKSGIAYTLAQAQEIADEIGFPLILRPSFTMGGSGSGIVFTREEFVEAANKALESSPISEVLIEESVLGWKEFELEVMRDNADNCVIICSIENFDPMGVHTGDSITVAPIQTLTDKEYQKMRDMAFACIRKIGVETGGSNVQFALNPANGRIVVIEMNPRVSRSSALASKATGFPIAKIAAKLAVGYRLDEISNDITQKTPACFEPTIDYCVVKVPRFAFEKFTNTNQTLGSQMKSVGEVMAIGRTFRESLQKAIRGLEIGRDGLGGDGTMISSRLHNKQEGSPEFEALLEDFKHKLRIPNCDRIFNVKNALQLGVSIEKIHEFSSIDPWFIAQIKEILDLGAQIRSSKYPLSHQLMLAAKQDGFSDKQIAYLTKKTEKQIRALRKKLGIVPTYKVVDTCAGEFPAMTPYFYSTYESQDEGEVTKKKKVIILGGGPNRIGQGIEFDYCCVHAVQSFRQEGYETIMVNCNPETVSTDYDISDRLYFEPLTFEDVMNIVEKERPEGVVVQFGGQTPLNLTLPLADAGVKILGTSPDSIDITEDRERFGKLLGELKIRHPECGSAWDLAQAQKIAHKIGYPVMVRPSYVLGGRGMKIVYDEATLENYIKMALTAADGTILKKSPHPILIDRFLGGAKEVDVDALSDGKNCYLGGIMEHIEEAGIHSGDSACILPAQTLSAKVLKTITDVTKSLARKLKVKGLLNIQYAVQEDTVYILEVNPRASRTVPFVSKTTGIPLAKMAAKVMAGNSIIQLANKFHKELKKDVHAKLNHVAVKEAVFPWNKFPGTDVRLSPEMRSTGEVMGIDKNFPLAFYKSQVAAGSDFPTKGTILFSLKPDDKNTVLPLVKDLVSLGFKIIATEGTYQYLQKHKIAVGRVLKIGEGRPNVVDIIKNREVVLVVNTPSSNDVAQSHGHQMRSASIQYHIPIVTTLSSLQSFVQSVSYLHKNKNALQVYSLQEYAKSFKK